MPRSETVDPTPQGDAVPAPEFDEEALFPAPDGPAPSQASEAARIRRARQTTRNLILALIATLAAVGLMLVLVPRDDSSQLERVDWAARAESLQGQAAMTLASPVLPDGWYANHADYEDDTTDGLQTWDVGFVTPANAYIGLQQVHGGNPTWLANQLADRPATGERTIAGHVFEVHDQRGQPGFTKGQNDYALVGEAAGTTLILNGTAEDDEFERLVTATLASLGEPTA